MHDRGFFLQDLGFSIRLILSSSFRVTKIAKLQVRSEISVVHIPVPWFSNSTTQFLLTVGPP